MIKFFKKYYGVLLIFVFAGIVGTFLISDSLLASYPPKMQEQMIQQGMTETLFAVVGSVQYAAYGFFLGIFGIILAKKIGLWQDHFRLEFKPFSASLMVGIIGGIAMIAFDILWFGREIQPIADSYLVKPDIATILGSMILGGIIEEVMLRLFMMSLIAFLFIKVFGNSDKTDLFLVIANVISAALFAAAHLPSTQILFGLTPLIVFRCFLLNGGFGLLFGRMYRKYGIVYAMIAHVGCHLVSKLIWIFAL